MVEELKPCPFCNGRAHEFTDGIYQTTPSPGGWHSRSVTHYIMCQDCHGRTGYEEDIQIAYDLWNKRHDK